MVKHSNAFLIFITLNIALELAAVEEPTCSSDGCTDSANDETKRSIWTRRYILYDVNPGEGFNLRRDVYMRIASLTKLLRENEPQYDWVLVLPTWGPLYHWNTLQLQDQQLRIPWRKFFDVKSLNGYVPVLEFEDFLLESSPGNEIEELYTLQHYPDTFSGNFQWAEKYDIAKCLNMPSYRLKENVYRGFFWGYSQVYAKEFKCLSIQGQVSTLAKFLKTTKAKSIMIDHAEVILHDAFGDINYWNVRRSLRFSKHLIDKGNVFRKTYLNSTDESDNTVLPQNWRDQKSAGRNAIGGPYIAVHLRRQDYAYAHPDAVPNISHAIRQIRNALNKYKLKIVFVATDGSSEEFNILKKEIPEAIKFSPTKEERMEYLDGGVAIIDQWICAHARHFIGTAESTFSFRIQEEREILGFPVKRTFNSFCGDGKETCSQPSKWTITF